MKVEKYTFPHSGPFVKAILKEKNITQTALAKSLGLHPQIVHNWGYGMAKVPAKHIKAISSFLSSCPIDQAAIAHKIADMVIKDETVRVLRSIE